MSLIGIISSVVVLGAFVGIFIGRKPGDKVLYDVKFWIISAILLWEIFTYAKVFLG